MNRELLITCCLIAALLMMAGGVVLATLIGSPRVGWFIGWATAVILGYADKKVTAHLRDSDGTR